MSNHTLSDLLHNSQKKFGDLLRQICIAAGYTQAKLAREAQAEKYRLINACEIRPKDFTGSFEATVLSKIMKGEQPPTYYQVFIWIAVLKRHFASAEFAAICAGLGVDCPKFEPEWEYCLWYLSSFVPPDEFGEIYEHIKDLEIIEIVEERVL